MTVLEGGLIRSRLRQKLAEALERERVLQVELTGRDVRIAELAADNRTAWDAAGAAEAKCAELAADNRTAWDAAGAAEAKCAELAADNRTAWDAAGAARAELQAITSDAYNRKTCEKLGEQASLLEQKDTELKSVYRYQHLRGELVRELTRAVLNSQPLIPHAATKLAMPRVAEPVAPRDTEALVRKQLAAAEQEVPVTVRVPVRLAWGDVMVVVLPEKVSAIIAAQGLYEADITDALIRILQPGDIFFDVGAHYGYFSLLAARLVGPTGRVLSFEPAPATRQILEINAESWKQITLRSEALWSSETELPFNENIEVFSAFSSILQPRLDEATRSVFPANVTTVRTTTMDAVAAATGLVPRLVKIDAESAEGAILSGGVTLLRRQRPFVILELGDLGVEGAEGSRSLVDRMTAHGYRPFEYSEGRWRPHQQRETYGFVNVVFSPAEAAATLEGA
jgi:FkbM family methyltransferase